MTITHDVPDFRILFVWLVFLVAWFAAFVIVMWVWRFHRAGRS